MSVELKKRQMICHKSVMQYAISQLSKPDTEEEKEYMRNQFTDEEWGGIYHTIYTLIWNRLETALEEERHKQHEYSGHQPLMVDDTERN